ncbi:MAG: 8-amino-7-oxononanoate synthase [Solirubrobacteraceae bacterium]
MSVTDALSELREAGLLRELRSVESASGPRVVLDGRDVLLLCSNDYLGLAGDPRVRAAAAEAALEWGAGAGSSRLVSGSLPPHDALEADLAAYQGTEACLLFGSGYLANLGVITALTGPGEVVLSDALNHASIVDACRLSRADVTVYRHLDLEDLECGLRGAEGRRATVVTDAVFSMDGDVAELEAIRSLARAYDARLIVDAAHATGVVAPFAGADVVVGTLSKALGSYGAFACCDEATRALLINRARTVIYSTALPPAAVGAARAALALVDERIGALHANARVLRGALGAAVSDMPIVPLVFGDPHAALAASERALAAGVFAQAIRPPTVPDGTSRLRLVARADHDGAELAAAGALLAAL